MPLCFKKLVSATDEDDSGTAYDFFVVGVSVLFLIVSVIALILLFKEEIERL